MSYSNYLTVTFYLFTFQDQDILQFVLFPFNPRLGTSLDVLHKLGIKKNINKKNEKKRKKDR